MTDTDRTPSSPPAPRPWWRYGMVWFMLSGPAIVVVAGLVTAVIAFRNADVVLTETTTPTSLAAHALSRKP
jgi:uncharacterized protein